MSDEGASGLYKRRIGEVLLDEGVVSREQLDEALRVQKRKLGEILVEIGACKPEDLDRAVELQKMGATRADIYRRYLRGALVVILLLVGGLAVALLRLEAKSHLLLRIEKEALRFDEVAGILNDPSSPHKFDALRSLSRHVKDARAVDLIGRALRNERWYVQLYAAMLAKDSGSKALVGPLIPLLVDESRVVAPVALSALQGITGQTFGPSVKQWRAWAQANGIAVENPAK